MRRVIAISTIVVMTTFASASEVSLQKQVDELQAQVKQLLEAQETTPIETNTKKIQTLEKKQVYTQKKLSQINQQSANDNIKWDVDLRSSWDNIGYELEDGSSRVNPSIYATKLELGMGAKPFDDLLFKGKLAMYKTWGGNHLDNDILTKDWQENSRPDESDVRVKEAYFVYNINPSDKIPVSFSAGRRPSTEGFLANHRQGNVKPGSPLAHITNMEVDAAMFNFDLDNVLLPGSFFKVVYGRAHDPINQKSGSLGYTYVDEGHDDANVDFIVVPMGIYNDGQSNLMAQYTMVINSKGTNIQDPANPIKKAGAGTTHLGALSYQLDGLDEDIDFLDNSTFFASAAFTSTDPDSGYEMLGSTSSKTGHSFWAGLLFPDMMTEGGRFGLEYNYGSKYWTPMTWAEDTLIGSKIAARGNAYEAYWNIPIIGKNLTAQLRYTYIDHDYRSNTFCYWDSPEYPVDGSGTDSAQDFRLFVRYQY